jgi:low affinity Fe/Cu permease
MSSNKETGFTRFTSQASSVIGRPWAFVAALLAVVLWAISGPVLGFSDTWQLIINTSTTVITFLIVFVIQNTQNRDNLAINIKLDAMMKKMKITSKELIEAEEQSDKELEKEKKQVQNNTSKKRK